MNAHLPSSSSSSRRERALVLGGGGSTGNAWLIGVVAGLFDAGLDVTTADLTVGTSAGSGPGARAGAAGVQRVQSVIDASTDMDDMRRRMSAAALAMDAESDGSWSDRWRTVVTARLPRAEWPDRRILITAVDARTAEPVVFERDSGVTLVDAVAASTSSGLPYRIGDGLYIDGGFRINAENADLASGCARILVLSPFGGRSLTPPAWGVHLATQVDALRAAGSRVEVVGPSAEHEHLFGPNGMDVALRPSAARAGFDQGRSLAPSLARLWS